MSIIEKKFLPIFTGLILVCGLLLANYFTGWSSPIYATSNLASAFAPTTCTGKNILFVSAARPLPARDQPLVDHLIALGHAVVVRTDKEVLASDATGKDLVIISESVLSTNVNTKLRAVAVPLITWEGWLFDDLRMTGPLADINYGELLTATQIRIVDPTHPLAAGLTGDVQVVSINDQVNNKFHWGMPNQFATIVATTLGNARHAHIFAYEKGAQMFGMLAPARRIGIQNATGPYLNAAGWAIFDAAVDWAMGGCSGVPPTPTAPPVVTPTNTPVPPPPTVTNTPLATNPAPSPTGAPTATFVPTKTSTPRPGSTPTATTTHTPTPTVTSSNAHLTVTLTDFLFTDADGNNLVSSGDKLLYVIKIVNDGASAAQQIHVEDTLDADTALIAGATTTDQGTIIKGNGANDTQVSVDMGALAPGAQATISLQVRINQQLHDTQVQNQAIATFANVNDPPSGQVVVLSDDPNTPDRTDATITPLNGNQPQPNYKFFIPLVSRKN